MWWCSLALAASPAEVRDAWTRDADARAAHAVLPVRLTEADFTTLAAGKAVTRREDLADGAYAVGAILVHAPKEAVWVAIQDGPHFPDPPVSVTWLPSPAATRRVYMYLDLPAILSDRQWVAQFAVNAPLAAASGDRVWQRSWKVADPSLATNPNPDAVWVGTNTGAWTLVPVGADTLVVFSVRTVLGGMLPEWLTGRWAVGTLDEALGRLEGRAQGIPKHYDHSHVAVVRPDGTDLPAW